MITAADQIARVAGEVLSTLPDARVDAAKVVAAAEALRETARRWAALAPGDELVLDWPDNGRRRWIPARRTIAARPSSEPGQ